MSTPAAACATQRALPSATRRMLGYQLRRATSLRSTSALLIVSLLSVATPVFTAKAYVDGVMAPTPDAAASLLGFVGPTSGLVAGVFGALLLGHELRHGLTESSLVAFPRRSTFFSGGILAAGVGGLLLSLLPLVATTTVLTVSGLAGRLPAADPGIVVRSGCLTLAYGIGCAVLGVAVVALTESQAWGIIGPLVWTNVVEAFIRLALGESQPWHSFVTPLSSMRDALTTSPMAGVQALSTPEVPWWIAPTAFAFVIGTLVALGAARFERADL